ncbi:Putative ketoacyl reductase [Aquicella siphonis]|uniref:Ketoacyl reductase n=1 Tax=Aquicella siphonis TaxID=254247 RepID=A0A5E4PG37_9COXI|nr:SDR family NAD(P)-dependent oxidoreductase [Aquicella siphonis]VVC75306.1 Putative ketoacyl reductase [Aquicella siphonis]
MMIHDKLDNRVVFVTGGSRGIGKAIVEKFQSHDWRAATCSTTEEGVRGSGADWGMVCDVSDPAQVRAVINALISRFGRLDAVINNAGLAGSESLGPDEDIENWHRVISVNLNGTYYVCQSALAHLPDMTGRIVNIASVLGLKGVPQAGAYCAAKHGVVGLTRALSHDLAPRHITVNAICPGWVRTDMAVNRMRDIGLKESSLAQSVPLGRFIEPHEVADLAYFLIASEAGAGMTGQALVLDGGVLA